MMDHDSFQPHYCLLALISCPRFYSKHSSPFCRLFTSCFHYQTWWNIIGFHRSPTSCELACTGTCLLHGLVKRQWQTVRLTRANDTSDKPSDTCAFFISSPFFFENKMKLCIIILLNFIHASLQPNNYINTLLFLTIYKITALSKLFTST